MDTVEMMDSVDMVDLMVRDAKVIIKIKIPRALPAKLELEIVMYALWGRING